VGVVLDCMKESGDEGSPVVLAEKKNERMVSERFKKEAYDLRTLSRL